MAAAVVCARAIVRDLYEPHEGARVMSLGAVGPGRDRHRLRRSLGGLLAAPWAGARAGRAGRLFGAVCWPSWRWRMPETAAACATRARCSWRRCCATGPHVLRAPDLPRLGAAVACTYGGLFSLLAGSSFVYIDVLGFSSRWPTAWRWPRARSPTSSAPSVPALAAAPRPARRGAARRGLHAGRRRWAWRPARCAGVHAAWAMLRAAVALSRSATASTSPAARPARSGRSRSRPAPPRRWPASCWRWPRSASACGSALAMDGTVHPLALGVGALAAWPPRAVAWTLVQRHGEAAPAA